MTAHQLDESQRTEKSSKAGFHKVYFDDCDRRLSSLQSKWAAFLVVGPLRFSSRLFDCNASAPLKMSLPETPIRLLQQF
jgi:hypothetical protein